MKMGIFDLDLGLSINRDLNFKDNGVYRVMRVGYGSVGKIIRKEKGGYVWKWADKHEDKLPCRHDKISDIQYWLRKYFEPCLHCEKPCRVSQNGFCSADCFEHGCGI